MKVKVKSLSCVQLLRTPWTAAYQAPLSMGFSRQEYWSGVPLPSPNQNTLLLLLLSRFSRVRLCSTPLTAAHQAPPSLGFSRQEHWSGFLLGEKYKPLFGDFPGDSAGKESAWNAGDLGLIPGLGRFPGEGKGYPLQYSWASLVTQLVKNLPGMLETWV